MNDLSHFIDIDGLLELSPKYCSLHVIKQVLSSLFVKRGQRGLLVLPLDSLSNS